jgi:hypothetical protein
MAEVFVSYSHQDHEFVSRLSLDLEDRGADVWIDRIDIHAGTQWRQSIADGIRDCTVYLLVVSPESLASEWAVRELRLAIEHDRPVIPLLYRRARIPEHLRAELESYQYLSFRQGSYAQNLDRLVAELARHGVSMHALDPAAIERQDRRRLLDKPPPVEWGSVLTKVPGWAFAWGLGWLVIWSIVSVVASLGFNRILGLPLDADLSQLLWMPVCGFVGGFAGGLLAGLLTMLALRFHAASIGWKHQKIATGIWAVAGTIACALIFALLLFGAQGSEPSEPADCSGLNPVECFQARLGQSMSDALGTACLGVFAILFAVMGSAAVSLILGLIAGGVAVRRIRRLEPGILGRQAAWVVIGWGLGALLAIASGMLLLSQVTGSG